MPAENLNTCQAIIGQRDLLADKLVARHCSLRPDLASRYGDAGRSKCVADARRHLDALSQAIAAGRSALFVDYVAWAKIVLSSRGIPVQDLTDNLEACGHSLVEVLPPDQAAVAEQYLLDSLSCLPSLPVTTPSYLSRRSTTG